MKNTKSLNFDIFPDEETFRQIYSECLEKEPLTSDSIIPSFEELGKLFEQYIAAVQAQTFRYAYQCGYQKGITLSAN